jgi:hypothetical protein
MAMKRSTSSGVRPGPNGSPAAAKPRSISAWAPRPTRLRAADTGKAGRCSPANTSFSAPIRSGAVSTSVPSRSKAITAPFRLIVLPVETPRRFR